MNKVTNVDIIKVAGGGHIVLKVATETCQTLKKVPLQETCSRERVKGPNNNNNVKTQKYENTRSAQLF
jgi:hypothetical protein